MAKYYFTYGIEGQPFHGGWSEVEAPDSHAAVAAYRVFHPDKIEGIVNCACIYTEEQFEKTEMFSQGNFGFRAHETITLSRKEQP